MQHATVQVFVTIPTPHIKASPGKSSTPDDYNAKPLNMCQQSTAIIPPPARKILDIDWQELDDIEHLTRGGSSLIYSAWYQGKPVVVKTLRPKIRESDFAMSDIESELAILSRLNHVNIVQLLGAGVMHGTGVRFLIFEKLDGGTLASRLGFDSIQSNKHRFWKKKRLTYHEALGYARSLATAVQYLHETAVENGMVLHRDLKPDNIAFTRDGTVKLLDFGLARLVENANPRSNEVYSMSGETGSLRYMAPEVAKQQPYNHKADVYSFGVILWEMLAGKKSFNGLRTEEEYFGFVVKSGGRPPFHDDWSITLCSLISDCWHSDLNKRPDFEQIITRLDKLLATENEKKSGAKGRSLLRRIKEFIERSPKRL